MLWHAQTLLREYRGDGHIAALVTAGLSGLEAAITHVATGDVPGAVLVSTRAWPADEWDAGVDGLRARGLLEPGAELALTEAGRTPAAVDRGRDRRAPRSRPTSRSARTGARASAPSRRPWSQAIVDGGLLRPACRLTASVDRGRARRRRSPARAASPDPRDTQLCRSAHTSIGGRTTSALSSATATLTATMMPKSRSSGSDDAASTATPEIAVSADTMNARPVRAAATSTACSRFEPAPALLHEPQEDQRRELGTRRDHERTAHRGHRTQREAGEVGEQRRGTDRDEHRHERQQRPDDRPQPDREEEEHERDREVGEQDAVRLEVVEEADADDREARRRGADARPAARAASRISFTTTARLASDAGVVAKIRLLALPSALTVDFRMPSGATSKTCFTSSPVGTHRLGARAPR